MPIDDSVAPVVPDAHLLNPVRVFNAVRFYLWFNFDPRWEPPNKYLPLQALLLNYRRSYTRRKEY